MLLSCCCKRATVKNKTTKKLAINNVANTATSSSKHQQTALMQNLLLQTHRNRLSKQNSVKKQRIASENQAQNKTKNNIVPEKETLVNLKL
jgi:lipopolysaccharide export system protein LptC